MLIRGKFKGSDRDKTGTVTTGWVPACLLKETPALFVRQELQDFIECAISHAYEDFGTCRLPLRCWALRAEAVV